MAILCVCSGSILNLYGVTGKTQIYMQILLVVTLKIEAPMLSVVCTAGLHDLGKYLITIFLDRLCLAMHVSNVKLQLNIPSVCVKLDPS